MLVGTYVNEQGDTLRLNPDHAFRIEMAEPDTASAMKQLKFTSGRWHRERNTIHLTVASKLMGEYWQCAPLKAAINRLRRPVACEGKGPDLAFRKVRLKPGSATKKEAKEARKRLRDEEME